MRIPFLCVPIFFGMTAAGPVLESIPQDENIEDGILTPDKVVRIPPDETQEKIRKEYGPKFRIYETDHFRVISDTSPRYHRVVAGVTELFYLEVYPRFFKRKMKPVDVYLIHDGDDFNLFVKERGHGDSASSYGFYSGDEGALYARRFFPDGSESGVGTLFHEIIHAMVHADFRKRPPTWFEEGFASLFERGRIVKGRWIYGNPNPWREAEFRPVFERGDSPDLETYLTMTDEEFRAENRQQINYHTGRSLFLYILYQGEDKLVRFVEQVRAGRSGPGAIKLALGKSRKAIEEGWRDHIVKVNFGGYYAFRGLGEEDIPILEIGVGKHPYYGYLRLHLAWALTRVQRNMEALEHAKAALEDPRFIFPQDAYDVIGSVYRFGEPSKAIEAFRTAISFQPWVEDVMEYSYKQLASLLQLKKDEEGARKILDELERLQAEDRR